MTPQEYTFVAARPVSKNEAHCLWNTLTDKKYNHTNTSFKMSTRGTQLTLVCTDTFVLSAPVTLNHQSFALVSTKPASAYNVSVGDQVLISGLMSYSVHENKSRKDRCPVRADGSMVPKYQQTFLDYLTKTTGVDATAAHARGDLEVYQLDIAQEKDKVYLNDLIVMKLRGDVVDATTTQSLAFNAIGRRKAYACGAMSVDKLSV